MIRSWVTLYSLYEFQRVYFSEVHNQVRVLSVPPGVLLPVWVRCVVFCALQSLVRLITLYHMQDADERHCTNSTTADCLCVWWVCGLLIETATFYSGYNEWPAAFKLVAFHGVYILHVCVWEYCLLLHLWLPCQLMRLLVSVLCRQGSCCVCSKLVGILIVCNFIH